MRRPQRLLGRAFVSLHRYFGRAGTKAFSLLAAGGFASFGRRTVLQRPIRLQGERWISIGADVFVGASSWLQVLEGADGPGRLEIGDGCDLTGNCVLSAAASVRLGRHVLLARNVYVSDHTHAHHDISRPVMHQGVTNVAPVEICDGAWLGQNAVVCPGVRIGRGAVIGANSVVLDDVPDYAVAVGAPARVVRRLDRSPDPVP